MTATEQRSAVILDPRESLLLRSKRWLREYRRSFAVALGWGVSLAALTLWSMFQGLLIPYYPIQGVPAPTSFQFQLGPLGGTPLIYLLFFVISVISASLLGDVAKSIISFGIAFAIAGLVVYEVLTLPGVFGSDVAFREALATVTQTWTLLAFVPIPLLAGFLGTLVGAGIGEAYLM